MVGIALQHRSKKVKTERLRWQCQALWGGVAVPTLQGWRWQCQALWSGSAKTERVAWQCQDYRDGSAE